MDLQGAMKNVDAQEREDRIGGAGAVFVSRVRPLAPSPAEIEVERLTAEKALEVAEEVRHRRACHALAAAMSAALAPKSSLESWFMKAQVAWVGSTKAWPPEWMVMGTTEADSIRPWDVIVTWSTAESERSPELAKAS